MPAQSGPRSPSPPCSRVQAPSCPPASSHRVPGAGISAPSQHPRNRPGARMAENSITREKLAQTRGAQMTETVITRKTTRPCHGGRPAQPHPSAWSIASPAFNRKEAGRPPGGRMGLLGMQDSQHLEESILTPLICHSL